MSFHSRDKSPPGPKPGMVTIDARVSAELSDIIQKVQHCPRSLVDWIVLEELWHPHDVGTLTSVETGVPTAILDNLADSANLRLKHQSAVVRVWWLCRQAMTREEFTESDRGHSSQEHSEGRVRQVEADAEFARRLQEDDGREYPTKREASNAASRQKKASSKLKVTGGEADFLTLGLTRSHDPISNLTHVIHARMATYKWKQMVLLLRMKEAYRQEEEAWRRPVRQIALLFGNEVSALWGHLGVASRELKGPKGAGLFK